MAISLIRYVSVVLIGCVLGACASWRLDYESQTHTVRRGETLYTIAWQHGIDYRELASLNGLRDPDLIYPGQQLRLRPGSENQAVRRSPPPAQASPRVPLPAPAVLPQPAWIWPTQGQIAAGFGSHDGIGTGIAVSGRRGQSIVSAAPGRVVYVGTGLVGYGQLVIIKHSDTWLSAYGHTEQVIVSQGDDVSRGERIGSMGLGPRRQPRLHFEIRRNGTPVNPLALLSARS